MIWGNFTLNHYISLVVAVFISIAFYFIFKALKKPYRTIVMFILSLSGVAATIYNIVTWNSPLEYLPLELCSITSIVLPIVILTKNKVLGNTIVLWSLGALMALIMNNGVANVEIFSMVFFFYYFPHIVLFVFPIIMILLGDIELKFKYIVSTVLLTAFVYTIAHIANVTLNNYFVTNDIKDYQGNIIQVNYMYSVSDSGIPVLAMFRKIIPYDYWCMYLILPIVIIYLGIIDTIYYFATKNKIKVTYIG